jgi:hypothetical protein
MSTPPPRYTELPVRRGTVRAHRRVRPDRSLCQMCGKASGGPLATNAPVARAALHLSAGRELLREYESSPGEKRVFCGRCGSPIYSHPVGNSEVVRVRVGANNEPLSVRPVASYYTGSKCNWWDIHNALPRFETD